MTGDSFCQCGCGAWLGQCRGSVLGPMGGVPIAFSTAAIGSSCWLCDQVASWRLDGVRLCDGCRAHWQRLTSVATPTPVPGAARASGPGEEQSERDRDAAILRAQESLRISDEELRKIVDDAAEHAATHAERDPGRFEALAERARKTAEHCTDTLGRWGYALDRVERRVRDFVRDVHLAATMHSVGLDDDCGGDR